MLATRIVDTTQRGIRILNDLLDITRSAFGTDIPVVKAPMDMGQLGVQLVEEMRSLAQDRTIDITIAEDTNGEWDGSRVGQVFSNLIGNAVQYSPAGSTISVTIAGGDGDVSMIVHNGGSTIPSDKLATMFEARTRGVVPETGGAVPETDRGGMTHLGLGLYIAKKIVAAHNGDLSVVSTGEAGTIFTVRLPRH